nr:MAG TPA: hypothetical protein [Caudoviricetes sp.]
MAAISRPSAVLVPPCTGTASVAGAVLPYVRACSSRISSERLRSAAFRFSCAFSSFSASFLQSKGHSSTFIMVFFIGLWYHLVLRKDVS